MAKKGNKRTNLEANEAFLQYEEEVVKHPAYAQNRHKTRVFELFS